MTGNVEVTNALSRIVSHTRRKEMSLVAVYPTRYVSDPAFVDRIYESWGCLPCRTTGSTRSEFERHGKGFPEASIVAFGGGCSSSDDDSEEDGGSPSQTSISTQRQPLSSTCVLCGQYGYHAGPFQTPRSPMELQR